VTDSLLVPDRVPDPCVLVIFGASGDLTRRKLIPAVWHLQQQGRLPEQFALVGGARSAMSPDDFRARMGEALHEFVGVGGDEVDHFLSHLDYVSGDPGDAGFYERLGTRLQQIDEKRRANPVGYALSWRNHSATTSKVPAI
jgi:glucose-6-phosphate 1-dehydrogenase